MVAKGYGESEPKADNNTAEGRELNRRTEIEVLNKEALKGYLSESDVNETPESEPAETEMEKPDMEQETED